MQKRTAFIVILTIAIAALVVKARADTSFGAGAEELVKLAKQQFADDSPALYPSEEEMLVKAANGEWADYSQTNYNTNSITIRASRLRWLCTDPNASKLVARTGIQITGAQIGGALDLKWAKIDLPLDIEQCEFTGPINLEHVRVPEL